MECARDSDFYVMGDLKAGAEVTVYCRMTAAKAEVKEVLRKK